MVQLVPMWRLTERMVRSGLVMAWRLATSPTRTSPVLEKATTEGVVRAPSALGMTVGSPPASTATTELVVPRSMPTALGMGEPPVDSSTENLSVMVSTLGTPSVFHYDPLPHSSATGGEAMPLDPQVQGF